MPSDYQRMSFHRPAGIPAQTLDDRAFAKGHDTALRRLIRLGVPSDQATAWVTAWDVTTVGLVDFRRADDFWRLGYEYAREEYARGFAPPALPGSNTRPIPALSSGEHLGRTG